MVPDFSIGNAAGKNEPATKPPYTGSHYGVSLAIPFLSEALFARSTVNRRQANAVLLLPRVGVRVADSACERACDEAKTKAGVKMADGGEKTKTQRRLHPCYQRVMCAYDGCSFFGRL